MNMSKQEDNDVIDNPKHYTSSQIQPVDAISDWNLNFNLGQVCKYISRAGKKPGSTYEQDCKKARFYLQREIEKLEKEKL